MQLKRPSRLIQAREEAFVLLGQVGVCLMLAGVQSLESVNLAQRLGVHFAFPLFGGVLLFLYAMVFLSLTRPPITHGKPIAHALRIQAAVTGFAFGQGFCAFWGVEVGAPLTVLFSPWTYLAIVIFGPVAWIAGYAVLQILGGSKSLARAGIIASLLVATISIWIAQSTFDQELREQGVGTLLEGLPWLMLVLILAGVALACIGVIAGCLIRLGEGTYAGPETDLDVESG
jgi:fucose 4-O-acetylase-like acetyltransferase